MKIRVALIALLACYASAQATEELSSRSWRVDDRQSLNLLAPSTASVTELVNDALDTDWKMNLCSYKFIDVAGDHVFRLIASVDAAGKRTCGRVVVIAKQSSNFVTLHDWKTMAVPDISRSLQDLDRDGTPELIIPQSWSRYEAGQCFATWQTVYRWENNHFVDRSATYPKTYIQRLEILKDRIKNEADPSCDYMEMDKIARYLNPKATTGFDRAVTWMTSPDATTRRRAATVFADIKDDASHRNLLILAKDRDPLVAESAKIYLELATRPKE